MQITDRYTNEEICNDIIRFYIEDSIHEKRQLATEDKKLARAVEKHRDERLISFLADLDELHLLPLRVNTIEQAIHNQPDGDFFVAVVDARYSNNEFTHHAWEQVESFTLDQAEYEQILNAYDEQSVLPLKAILFTSK